MNYHLFAKNSKVCTQSRIFQKEINKIYTQSRADSYIRRKRFIVRVIIVWMHLKIFLKLKKKPKSLSSGQIYEKKPKKKQKTQKKPLGWVFLKKPGFFQPCFKGVPYAEYLKHIACVHKNAAGKFPCPQNSCQAGGDFFLEVTERFEHS
jgi:hypothetical protein